PIAPFAMLAFLGFSGLTLVLFTLQIIPSLKGAIRYIIPFTAIMALLSLSTWVVQNSLPGASENGALASTFPAFEKMQEQMASLVENGERIAVATEKTAVNTDDIAESTQIIAETGKKEISENPIKELANLNIEYDGQGFWKSLRIAQPQILSLFIQAGLPVETESLWSYIISGNVSPKSARALVDAGFKMTKEECDFSSLIHREFEGEVKPRRTGFKSHISSFLMSGPPSRTVAWHVENSSAISELSNPKTVEAILTLCPKTHAVEAAKLVSEAGIAYYEAYEEARLAGLSSCEKSVDKTSFEEFVALKFRYIYENGRNSKVLAYDETGREVQPHWPNRELTLPEEIYAGDFIARNSDSELFQVQRGVARNDTLVEGSTVPGYQSVLKSICRSFAYKPLNDWLLDDFQAIIPAFEAAS
ncbi:MAG: hypothetical protein ACI9LZ_002959, partial [Glaciecola sp.]